MLEGYEVCKAWRDAEYIKDCAEISGGKGEPFVIRLDTIDKSIATQVS